MNLAKVRGIALALEIIPNILTAPHAHKTSNEVQKRWVMQYFSLSVWLYAADDMQYAT